MIHQINSVLSKAQLEKIARISLAADWQAGVATAGAMDKTQKNNSEIRAGSAAHKALFREAMLALANNTELEMAISPVGSSVPLFSRYGTGMSYPEHLDEPIANFKNPSGSIFPARFRADVSATLFLNDPSEYEGGELRIKTPSGDRAFRCPAGTLVLYPSNYLHEVTTVESGERRVAVLWFQSLFANVEERYELFNLRNTTRALLKRYPDDDDVKAINGTLNFLTNKFARST